MLPAGEANHVSLPALLDLLGRSDVLTLLVEGGGVLHGSFFDAGLVDKVHAVVAPMIIGGRGAPVAVAGQGAARRACAARRRGERVDDAGRAVGVIDWGDIHLGDPAVDLGIAHGFLPPAALDTFYRRYGSIEDAQLRFARFRALHYAVILPIYGRDVGDDALVREGLTALRYLR